MAGVTTTHPVSLRTHGKAELMFLEEDRCSPKIIIKIFIQEIYIKVYKSLR
jgi:hypothetical protein